MQITIKQAEVEEALRHHLTRMGITGEIQEVSFTQSRSEGQLITSIEIGVLNETGAKQVEKEPVQRPAEVVAAITPVFSEEQSSTEESGSGEKATPSGQSIFS